MSDLAPVRREVMVPGSPAIAFDVFTRQIGGWWPIPAISVFHNSTVAFVDDRIVEHSATGEETVWGTVTEWLPPHSLSFTWHPGKDESQASRITVTFAESDQGTLVTLIHDGWESFADPAVARDEYNNGWQIVLAGYVQLASAPDAGA
ncbi:SRPBCC domain-containing protein [Subtercola lobariae]|uniref:Activator of Hsp90 ATPase homologue 1/2-like C-terminal domain-containing protein n=1 Tax=Subtercola lobariae TaxID=1588641 RepID=A0A917B1J8_9MICO|nr:SRPBCC domain-containing protein [Subtercola lobariae]GGF14907.1 hypothetical protein GCM10011399_06000 [Subtercola lobariae]